MTTYTAGRYKAEVTDSNHVNVYRDDDLIDWPGPWSNTEGAELWASLIVVDLDTNDGN